LHQNNILRGKMPKIKKAEQVGKTDK
jgi:hypothetical protein